MEQQKNKIGTDDTTQNDIDTTEKENDSHIIKLNVTVLQDYHLTEFGKQLQAYKNRIREINRNNEKTINESNVFICLLYDKLGIENDNELLQLLNDTIDKENFFDNEMFKHKVRKSSKTKERKFWFEALQTAIVNNDTDAIKKASEMLKGLM